MPLVLGGAILYWMYRGEDWQTILHVMTDEMNWTWMLLSFPFGILAQMFRGWRWKQTLDPVGEHPRTSVSIHSIFLSYATSLLVPRMGEFTRCGVLKRYDNISFPKALGTVVTERAIDSLLIMGITATVLLLEMSTFGIFFRKTGTNLQGILHSFSWAGYFVAAVCLVAMLILLHFLLRKLSIYNKVKATIRGIWQGIISLKGVRLLHAWHLAQLLPALLPYLLLLRLHGRPGSRLCTGHVHRRQHRSDCAHTQRCRSLALCRQDDADTVWSTRRACAILCADSTHRPDPVGRSIGHLRLDSAKLYENQNL